MGLIKRAKDNYFILGGIDSRDFDMVVSCDDAFAVPERDVDTYEVPGRNGDLIVDNGRFRNIDITYDVVIEKDFPEKINAFKRAIGALRGYVRLEDTFDSDVYRMASVDKVRIEELGSRYNSGTFAITLNCKPQKWLKSGEEPICIIEGTFRNYVSTDEGPDIPSEATMRTGYMSVPADMSMTIKLHNEHDNAYVEVIGYNSGGVETYREFLVPEYERWLPSGDYQAEIEFPSGTASWEFYYNITGSYIGEILTVGDTNAEFIYTLAAYGETRNIDAILREKVEIQNPTGYATKPIIEYFAYYDSNIKITNLYSNGEDAEYYELSFDVSGETNKHIFLDCDQQYAYNSDGKNVSNIMSIVTAESAGGKSLVFPEFGTDKIRIEFLYRTDVDSISQHNTIIFVYPRWWTT